MMLSRRAFARVVLVGFTVFGAGGCLLRSRGTPVARDALAPDFTLPDQDGHAVSLAELRAKGPVVVVFYRGHW